MMSMVGQGFVGVRMEKRRGAGWEFNNPMVGINDIKTGPGVTSQAPAAAEGIGRSLLNAPGLKIAREDTTKI